MSEGEIAAIRPSEAASRVRSFLAARKAFRSRLDPRRTPIPDRIIAEYGYLDVNDLQALVDAVEGP